ncbi:MAG: hydrogenase expression/formation protein HypE [Planctomycetota bacterium]
MAHGGGGRRMHQLLEQVVFPILGGPPLADRHDGAPVASDVPGSLVLTTDSFVVRPLFFPGGDIGTLSVCGTINDLAMCGASAEALTLSMILGEGLEIAVLERVLHGVRSAADRAGVSIVTGDTKVVDGGASGDLFLNTAGLGRRVAPRAIRPGNIRPGDVVLVSGDLGRHGIAVLSARESLGLEGELDSDVANLWPQVAALLDAGVDVHCLRDLTRGGLAAAVTELAEARGLEFELLEERVPVNDVVRGVCELLGFDPLNIACEGRFLLVTTAEDAERAIAALEASGGAPALVGRVRDSGPGRVRLVTGIGTTRLLDLPAGDPLPRIC